MGRDYGLRARLRQPIAEKLSWMEWRAKVLAESAAKTTSDRVLEAIGRSEAWQRRDVIPGDFASAEFRAFSQWNEDGIIQHLIRHTPIADRSFIEFGVEDYSESNTRFLLVNDNWRGLILDLSDDMQGFLQQQAMDWRYPIETVIAAVTKDNVNQLFAEAGFTGDIGLLSIDVDGTDLWLWEVINVIQPRIVVCEYNATWGKEHAVCVPYRPDFNPEVYHPSRLCFGASLPGLIHVAKAKGYDFVGCESHGVNAFFVRSDVNQLPVVSVDDGYRYSFFRSFHRGPGLLGHVTDRQERLTIVRDCLLEDVVTHDLRSVAEIYGV